MADSEIGAVLAGVVAVFSRAPRLVKVTTLLLGGCRWRWATPGVSTPGPSEQEER